MNEPKENEFYKHENFLQRSKIMFVCWIILSMDSLPFLSSFFGLVLVFVFNHYIVLNISLFTVLLTGYDPILNLI